MTEEPERRLCQLCKVPKPLADFGTNPRTCLACLEGVDSALRTPEPKPETPEAPPTPAMEKPVSKGQAGAVALRLQSKHAKYLFGLGDPSVIVTLWIREHAKSAGVDVDALTTPGYKYCPGCRLTKPNADFHIERKRPDGLSASCKICKRKSNKKVSKDYYKRNRVRILDDAKTKRFQSAPEGETADAAKPL